MILLYNHGQKKEEAYVDKFHRRLIYRRWSLNHQLATKKHYIIIIPEEDGAECESDKEVRGKDTWAIAQTGGETF
jgi:hypothetical protein